MEKKKLYYYIADSMKKNVQELVGGKFKELGARGASWLTYDTSHNVYYLVEGSSNLYINSCDEAFKNYVIDNGINIVDLIKKDEPEHTFKPFDKVLVRDNDKYVWRASFFSHYDKGSSEYPYSTVSGCYAQCIPSEGNEHLAGTNKNI